jgi:hypothetical protein
VQVLPTSAGQPDLLAAASGKLLARLFVHIQQGPNYCWREAQQRGHVEKREVPVGKRLLTLLAMVAGIALVIAGVAFAAGDLAQSDESTMSPAVIAESAAVDEVTISTTANTETPAVEDEVTADEVPTSPHDGDWGMYISGLREKGINTPAAVLMGKTVPGWEKKQPPTTEAPTSEEATTEEATGQATTGHGHAHGYGHGHGHGKK